MGADTPAAPVTGSSINPAHGQGHILLVEDEQKLAQLLAEYLTQSGFEVTLLSDGLVVMPWLQHHQPQLAILDIMLPGRDGLSLLQEIRQRSELPIMMTTARVEEIDRLLGLELGADDYICKPYSPREVVARVKAMLRRQRHLHTPSNDNRGLHLDTESYRISYGGVQVQLTALEFRLFHTMYQKPGRIFSRQQLMDTIYLDQRIVSDRTVDSHIKKLRRKLDELGTEHDLIDSIYGAGYRFDIPA